MRGHRVRGDPEADIRSLGHWLFLFSPTPTLFFFSSLLTNRSSFILTSAQIRPQMTRVAFKLCAEPESVV